MEAVAEAGDDWRNAAEALEEAGLLYHAQQIRALVALHERRPESDEKRVLQELAREGAEGLEGKAPRSIWGDVRIRDGEHFLDSIYARGFPSVRVEEVLGSERRLRSGETQRTFRTTYAGHRYSGRSSQVWQGQGWLQLQRGAAITRRRR